MATKLFVFDYDGYTRALKASLKRAALDLRNEVYRQARANAAGLPFKDNEVELADGSVTSDAERRDALLDSIITEHFEWMSNGVFRTAVSAMKANFEDSHIGIYYEYGTGSNFDRRASSVALARTAGDWNPYRTPFGPIVTRSKHINDGVWRDMGGNLRKTESPRGGDDGAGFRSYIGEDIEAYYWFREAFRAVKDRVIPTYRDAVNKVPFVQFIKHPPSVTINKR